MITKSVSHRYSEARVIRWLSWMALQMKEHDQTVFMIEDLQINWLGHTLERRVQWILPVLIVGVIIWLYVILIGVVSNLGSPMKNLGDLPMNTLVVGLMVGGVYATGKKMHFIATMEVTVWSWRRMRRNFLSGFKQGGIKGSVVGLVIWIIFGIVAWVQDGTLVIGFFAIYFGLFLLLIGAIIGGLVSGGSGGWERKIPQSTTEPNEGIKLTLKSSLKGLILGLISGLIVGMLAGLLMLLTLKVLETFSILDTNFELWATFQITGVTGAILGPIIGGLSFGGIHVIRHYSLRFLIYLRGYGPWNYTGLLDHAVDDLHFMQRVGGGYIFIHRMMLEHFAAMGDPSISQEVKMTNE